MGQLILKRMTWRRFVKDQSGAALVEYALLVALIGVACIVAMTGLSTSVSTKFNNTATSITSAGS